MPYAEFTLRAATNDTAGQLVHVTEAAALAAAPWIGQGNKIAADQDARDAMHDALEASGISCAVVIGEGEKDGAPELKQGTVYGDRRPPRYDLAVDQVEGTTFVANGQPGAMSIAALGERGSFLPWVGVHYMKKLVVGPRAAGLLDISLEQGGIDLRGDEATNMRRVAHALGKPITELTVAMLDRERNRDIREAAERIGARILLLEGGDVTPAIQTCIDREVDMLYSSGGAPEGVITAAAIAALGGNMQAKLDPQTPDQVRKAVRAGLYGKILNLRALVGDGELHFAATGITGNPLVTSAHEFGGEWYQGSSIKHSRPPARHNGHRRL